MNAQRYFAIAAAVAIVLVLALFLALAPAAPAAAQTTACYRPQGGASFTCGSGGSVVLLNGATLDMRTGANAVIGGDATISGTTALIGNVDVTGNLEVVDHIGNSGQTYYFTDDAVTVTNGGTVTPAETLVELTAAGAVGTSLGTCTDGQYVMFVNTANQTITITDTGTTRLASDWAGGQYDTLSLACVGVAWYEVARSAN